VSHFLSQRPTLCLSLFFLVESPSLTFKLEYSSFFLLRRFLISLTTFPPHEGPTPKTYFLGTSACFSPAIRTITPRLGATSFVSTMKRPETCSPSLFNVVFAKPPFFSRCFQPPHARFQSSTASSQNRGLPFFEFYSQVTILLVLIFPRTLAQVTCPTYFSFSPFHVQSCC